MNSKIKSMCLELAEMALELENLEVVICNDYISIWHLKEDWRELAETEVKFAYNKSIYFNVYSDDEIEISLEEALDYVKNLGGNDDE